MYLRSGDVSPEVRGYLYHRDSVIAVLSPQCNSISFDSTLFGYMNEAEASSPACFETDIGEHSRHCANLLFRL